MPGAYLDHAATAPLRPEARAAVEEVLDSPAGNPSGQHAWARAARRRLDDARDEVADLLSVAPGEVVWTSGGTEADDLAVTGVLAATGGRAACPAVEHHAVLGPVVRSGGSVLSVDGAGRVDLDELDRLLDDDPTVRLVTVALANNELGTLVDLEAVAAVVRRRRPGRERTLLHTGGGCGALGRPGADGADRRPPLDQRAQAGRPGRLGRPRRAQRHPAAGGAARRRPGARAAGGTRRWQRRWPSRRRRGRRQPSARKRRRASPRGATASWPAWWSERAPGCGPPWPEARRRFRASLTSACATCRPRRCS
ncbi:MAG: aminotransferase class V-fold PLP-dependent enzyme [Acidimicrobiales bacterium]